MPKHLQYADPLEMPWQFKNLICAILIWSTKIPGSDAMMKIWAFKATSASMPQSCRTSAVQLMENKMRGTNMQAIRILHLLRCIEHCSKFLAPNDYEIKLWSAVSWPSMNASPTTTIKLWPIPMAEIWTGPWYLAKKTKSIIYQL